jgi:hypothetical protein
MAWMSASDGVGRQGLQAGGDGGEGGVVAGIEVPIGVQVGLVAPAGAGNDQAVAGPGIGGPGAGQALVAMDHKVNGELTGSLVDPADGVGAGGGPLLTGKMLTEGKDVQRLLVVHARVREVDFHVHVREVFGRERRKSGAAGDDPHHVGAEPFGAQDHQGGLRSGFDGGCDGHGGLLGCRRCRAWCGPR